jgi:hypothetical protein
VVTAVEADELDLAGAAGLMEVLPRELHTVIPVGRAFFS